jgi:hypothetical protein
MYVVRYSEQNKATLSPPRRHGPSANQPNRQGIKQRNVGRDIAVHSLSAMSVLMIPLTSISAAADEFDVFAPAIAANGYSCKSDAESRHQYQVHCESSAVVFNKHTSQIYSCSAHLTITVDYGNITLDSQSTTCNCESIGFAADGD